MKTKKILFTILFLFLSIMHPGNVVGEIFKEAAGFC